MKNILLLFVAFLILMPTDLSAQGKSDKHQKQHNKAKPVKHYKSARYKTKGGPPPWAPAHGYRAKQHVYFRDYYTFYDPYRSGYVYWGGNDWIFTPRVPSFLANIDLGKARMQILGNLPLTTRPERNYQNYINTYPANTVNISVPVPPLPGR